MKTNTLWIIIIVIWFILFGSLISYKLGQIHGHAKVIDEFSKYCVVECGECGGINRVLPASCEGNVILINKE